MMARWMLRNLVRRRALTWMASGVVLAERVYRERQKQRLGELGRVPPALYSADGRWWWDGAQWHPVDPLPRATVVDVPSSSAAHGAGRASAGGR